MIDASDDIIHYEQVRIPFFDETNLTFPPKAWHNSFELLRPTPIPRSLTLQNSYLFLSSPNKTNINWTLSSSIPFPVSVI